MFVHSETSNASNAPKTTSEVHGIVLVARTKHVGMKDLLLEMSKEQSSVLANLWV
jgi:hypothetical protein